MQKHSQNALELAEWVSSREEISWVNYPGLNSSKYHNLANKYFLFLSKRTTLKEEDRKKLVFKF